MSVDLLLFGLVEGDEAVEDVVAGSSVVGATLVVREVVLHRADRELLLEAVDLVEEENDRGLDEPSRVADGVEQRERFLHTVHGLIFEQELVVFGDGDKEQNRGDVLKAVDPLLALRTLTTNIEHTVCQVANNERGLGDTGGLDTRTEDILVTWQVVGLGNAVDGVKVATWQCQHGGIDRITNHQQDEMTSASQFSAGTGPLTIWQSRSIGIRENA